MRIDPPVQKPAPTQEERLESLRERVNEWATTNYIPDEDIESIDLATLKEASLLAQTQPDHFALVSEDAERIMNEREKAELDRREQQIAMKQAMGQGPLRGEMNFEDFIAAKRKEANLPELVSASAGAPSGAPSASAASRQAGPADDAVAERPNRGNLMVLHDPDELAQRDTMGDLSLKPTSLPIADLALNRNPVQLLSDPRLVQASDIRNLDAFLNQLYLNAGTAKDRFHEADIYHLFEVQMQKLCPEQVGAPRRSDDWLTFTYFVANPLCVHCVFRRRPDLEKRMIEVRMARRGEASARKCFNRDNTIKDGYRIYSWLSHLYQEGFKEEDEEGNVPRAAQPAAPAVNGFE